MSDEPRRSTSGDDQTEEQKPSPEEYEHKGVGGGPEGEPGGEEDADRSARHRGGRSAPR